MINKSIENMLFENKYELLTPANKVSMVFNDNTLLHAYMILNNTSYLSVPVLDKKNKFVGLTSIKNIFSFLGEKIYDGFEILEDYKVEEALDNNFYIVKEDFKLDEVMRALINYNFLIVCDDECIFKGIITRSSLFKRINYMAHEFDKNYIISQRPKRSFFKLKK